MEGVGFTIHYEMIWDVWSQLVGVMQSQLGSHTTAYNILAFVPVVFVFDAVRNQRKTVAAVAQMTAVQQRNDVVQVQRPRTPSKTVPRPSEQLLAPPPAGGSADGNAAAAGRESTSKAPPIRRASTESLVDEDKKLLAEASTLDQLWFMLGVGNVAITAYVLGLSPTWYYAYYTPKVISLTFLRWITFVKKKQHYLLYDFCYWVNALCLLYCWVYPHSQLMFRVLFINACGPLAIAVLCFNHSLIFHSYAHMTSVVIHVSPLVLVYGLRWHSDARFNICEDFPTCDDVSHLQLIDEAMRYFYLPWSGLYFLWIFVALGRYLEEKNYQTLWDRVLGTGAVGKFLRLMLTKLPKLFVQGIYLVIHLGFCGVAMVFATLMFHHQLANFVWLATICGAVAYNGSQFYLQALEPLYVKAIRERNEGGTITSKNLKLLLSASMGLQTAVDHADILEQERKKES